MKHTRKTFTTILLGAVRTERIETYDSETAIVTVTKKVQFSCLTLWKQTHERPAKLADMWGRI